MSTLSDVTTRYATLADLDALEAMHARCSETSLYRRFHAPLPRLSQRMLRQLISPADGWSLLAERRGEVVALAVAAPVSGFEVEVGLLVEDRHQHEGIGSRMLRELAADSGSRGYRSLQLLAQPENDRVLSTVQKAGLICRICWQEGLVCVSMSVDGLAAAEMPTPA